MLFPIMSDNHIQEESIMFQKHHKMLIVVSLVGLALAGLIGCQMFSQDRQSPTTPAVVGGGRDRPE